MSAQETSQETSQVSATAPLVAVEGLHTYYGKSHILHGVSLTIGRGEVVGLLGRNGVGKSTTLKTIMGLVYPKQGKVLLEGRPVTALPAHKIAKLGIAYVPEDRRIFRLLARVGHAGAVEPGAEIFHHREQAEDAAILRHIGDAELGDLVRRQRGDGLGPRAAPALLRVDQAHDGLERRALADAVAAEQPTTSPRPTVSDTPCRMWLLP